MHLALSICGLLMLGVAVGIVSPALGIGGGILMVPALREFAGLDAHTAKGTSLFIIIFVAAVNSWRLNRGHEDKLLRLAGVVAAGSVLGGYFGGFVTQRMNPRVVTIIFIAALVILAARLLLVEPAAVSQQDVRRRDGLALLIGLVSGLTSGITGIGGGGVFVPLALIAGIVSNERVSGLSNTVMIATCTAATMAHLFAPVVSGRPWTVGQVSLGFAPLIFVGAQFGAPFGRKLNGLLTLSARRVVMAVLAFVIVAQLAYKLFQ